MSLPASLQCLSLQYSLTDVNAIEAYLSAEPAMAEACIPIALKEMLSMPNIPTADVALPYLQAIWHDLPELARQFESKYGKHIFRPANIYGISAVSAELYQNAVRKGLTYLLPYLVPKLSPALLRTALREARNSNQWKTAKYLELLSSGNQLSVAEVMLADKLYNIAILGQPQDMQDELIKISNLPENEYISILKMTIDWLQERPVLMELRANKERNLAILKQELTDAQHTI